MATFTAFYDSYRTLRDVWNIKSVATGTGIPSPGYSFILTAAFWTFLV
jgi:hypothetical protein